MVAYRLGGRYGRDRSAGTFETLTLARVRRMKVMELIARGEPDEIEELVNPAAAQPAPAGSWTGLHQQWLEGTHNLEPSTQRTYANHGQALSDAIGDRDPLAFDWRDCCDLVNALLGQGLAPGTVKAYFGTLRNVLDYAGVEPNPARDRRVKLPRQPAKQLNVPTRTHIKAIRDQLPPVPAPCLRHPGGNRDPRRRAHITDLGRPRRRRVQGQDCPGQNRLGPTLGQDPPSAHRQDRSNQAPRRQQRRTPPVSRPHRQHDAAGDQQILRTRPPHPATPPTTSDTAGSASPSNGGMPPAEVAQHAGHARQAITLNTYSHVITEPDDHHPLAWETHGPRTDTTQQHQKPNPGHKTHGPRTDTTPTQ